MNWAPEALQNSMENKTDTYFSENALKHMLAAHGKTVEKVIIYLWQNITDPNNSVELIDGIKLTFSDTESITFGCNETSEGLDIVQFNFQELKAQLEQEFNGKIKLHALDAGKTKMWGDVIGRKLESIQLTKQDEYYKSDSVLLDFGAEKRTISISPLDGLVADFYEDI